MEFPSCLQVCLLLTLSFGWIQATPRPDEHVRVTDKHRYWFAKKLSDSTERLQDHLPIIPSPLLAVTEDVTRLKNLDWSARSKREEPDEPDVPLLRAHINSPNKPLQLEPCDPNQEYDEKLKQCSYPQG